MGITAAVRGAIESLRAAFISGRISERSMERSEERLVTFGDSSRWAEPVRRPAAKSAGTRQNIRREEFAAAFEHISAQFPGESRSVRRTMARARAKRQFRFDRGLAVA